MHTRNERSRLELVQWLALPAEERQKRVAMLAKAPLRPKRDQEGHGSAPLFQTDIEEFTS